MSVYGTGVEAYRSTAKWLVSLVPTATIVASGIAFGPELVDQVATLSPNEFFDRHCPAVVGVLLIAGGLSLVVYRATNVLTARPPKVFGDAILQERAFGEGAALPFFIDKDSFEDARQRLLAWLDHLREPQTPAPAQPDSDVVKALSAAIPTVREWVLHDEVSKKFSGFIWGYAAGLVLMVVGLLVAAIDLTEDEAARREPPAAVTAHMTDELWVDMQSTVGCGQPVGGARPEVTLWLIAGDWDEPVLQVDGEGCTSTVDWAPEPKISVRPVGSES